MKKVTFNFKRSPAEGEKLARQARVILGVIESVGSIDYEDLVEKLNAPALVEELATRQEPKSILGFYRKTMVDCGYITVDTVILEKPKREKKKKVTAEEPPAEQQTEQATSEVA